MVTGSMPRHGLPRPRSGSAMGSARTPIRDEAICRTRLIVVTAGLRHLLAQIREQRLDPTSGHSRRGLVSRHLAFTVVARSVHGGATGPSSRWAVVARFRCASSSRRDHRTGPLPPRWARSLTAKHGHRHTFDDGARLHSDTRDEDGERDAVVVGRSGHRIRDRAEPDTPSM
jgi:hypothetical protein